MLFNFDSFITVIIVILPIICTCNKTSKNVIKLLNYSCNEHSRTLVQYIEMDSI